MLRANSFKSEFVRTIDGAAYQLTQCLLKLNKITDGALIRIVSLFKQLLKDLSKIRLNTRVPGNIQN